MNKNSIKVHIIGGGISGIYTMYNLKKKYPTLKVLLLEKDNRFGGRIYTYFEKITKNDVTLEKHLTHSFNICIKYQTQMLISQNIFVKLDLKSRILVF